MRDLSHAWGLESDQPFGTPLGPSKRPHFTGLRESLPLSRKSSRPFGRAYRHMLRSPRVLPRCCFWLTLRASQGRPERLPSKELKRERRTTTERLRSRGRAETARM